MTKTEFIKMLADGDCDFTVDGNEVVIPYGDTDTETVFEFDSNGVLRDTWSRRQYGAEI